MVWIIKSFKKPRVYEIRILLLSNFVFFSNSIFFLSNPSLSLLETSMHYPSVILKIHLSHLICLQAIIVQFRICHGHWIEALKTHLYRVSLDLRWIYSQIPVRQRPVYNCVVPLLLTQIQALSHLYLWTFYFRPRLTLYKWVFGDFIQRPRTDYCWFCPNCVVPWIVHATPTELGFFDMRDLHPFENYFCFYCIFILSFKKMALKISIPGSLN